jgi:phage gpG-like protein
MIAVTVKGDSAIEFELKNMTNRVHEAIRRTVTRESLLLLTLVKEKLSGPVLKNRTGTLRRSINRRQTETAESIEATVGTNLSYAAVHEYGFDGSVSVRAHMRHMTQAFGRPLATPVEAQVGGYSRHMHMPARSFLRSSLAERRDKITAALEAAVAGAVK